MALDDEVNEIVRFFSGQKSSIPSGTLESTDAEQMLNFICRKGRLRKIWGASIYAQPVNALGSGGTAWIELFRKRWMVQQGNLISYETAEGSKAFTALGTILFGDVNPVKSEKWINRIYLVNGVENKFYEDSLLSGEKFISLGIIPPGSGRRDDQPVMTLIEGVGGGTMEASKTYTYLFTWYDSARGVESLANGATVQEDGLWLGNNPAEITLSAAGTARVIGNIADYKAAGYDADRVNQFFVYRATQVDGQFKRITNGPFAIGNDEWQDLDGDDTNLGAVLDESISAPPSGIGYINGRDAANTGPRFVKFFRDQLWLFGVRLPGLGDQGYNPVTGIAYGSDVNNFDIWKYTYDVGRSTDQEDTGIGKYRNTLFFFKDQSAYYLDGTNPGNYQIKEIDTERGIIAPGSLQDTPVGCIGLAADGFVLFDSASPGKLISEEIQDELDSINFDHVDKIHSAYDLKEGKYECYIPKDPSTNISRVLIYDINMKTWQILSTRTGKSAAYGLSSKKRRVGLLGDSQNSRLYNLVDESQTQFAGQTIRARWASKHFDFGNPKNQKRLQFIKIKARSATDLKLSIDIIPDFGQGETITINDIEPLPLFSTWADGPDDEDGMEWDADTWAGKTVPIKFEVLAQVVARNIQIVIREAESAPERASFEIEEIVLEANLLGR